MCIPRTHSKQTRHEHSEPQSMTLTVTKVRFLMIHQLLKITSAPQSARSSHEHNQPKSLNKELTAEQQTVHNFGHIVFLN